MSMNGLEVAKPRESKEKESGDTSQQNTFTNINRDRGRSK